MIRHSREEVIEGPNLVIRPVATIVDDDVGWGRHPLQTRLQEGVICLVTNEDLDATGFNALTFWVDVQSIHDRIGKKLFPHLDRALCFHADLQYGPYLLPNIAEMKPIIRQIVVVSLRRLVFFAQYG